MKRPLKSTVIPVVGCAAALLLSAPAEAVDTRTLVPTSGNVTWEVNANWSPADYPNTSGTGGEGALIGDATANRTLSTSGVLSISELDIVQSSNVVSRLNLGGNLTASQVNLSSITNNTASAANLVIDVNSHTLELNSDVALTGPLTILADAGGIFGSRRIQFGSDSSVTGANVTLRSTLGSNNVLRGVFNASTTFLALGTSDAMFFVSTTAGTFTNAIGRFVVGDGVLASKLNMNLAATSANLQVRGDFIVMPNAAGLGFITDVAANKLRVGGNFIDTNTTGSYTISGAGTHNQVIFNGSPVTARTVDIRRSAGGVHFAVGVSGADTGNIRLAHDLTTTGTFIVRTGSKLDVVDHTLNTGDFTLQTGTTLGYKIGSDTGVINVAALSIDDFALHITNLPNNGWVNGSDLVLFNYAGTLTDLTAGPPTITVSDGWLTFDSFLTSGGTVRLTNVYIPEPTSAAALMAAGMLLIGARRGWGT